MESSMYPYQIYKVLADQHISDLRADTQSHGRMRATQLAATDRADRAPRLQSAVAYLVALLRVARRSAAVNTRGTSTAPSTRVATPDAGPMGCVA
jgi:hypothetical protein